MTKQEILELAAKIADGLATEEEIQRYNAVYNAMLPASEDWDESLGDKEDIRLSIKSSIDEQTSIPRSVPFIRRYKWAAAAAVLLCMLGAGYFIVNNKQTQVASAGQPATLVNDVMPGSEGAMLTLANGKTIMLDSAGNGALAEQGSTEIIKQNGAVVYNNQGQATEVVYNTMSTQRGRQYKLVLADGSKVWLNAASSISFPTAFKGKERKVIVTGEVYFEVAHNAAMPFIVEKDNMKVKVLGTHFNVNSYDDEASMNVTLLEGSVSVTSGTANILIKPGQQAQVKTGGVISLVQDVNTEQVMAWKNGVFHFEGTTINVLMRQLSRWYDVDIVYETKTEERFYADIPMNTNLSIVLKALELTGKVHFEIQGKKIIVKE